MFRFEELVVYQDTLDLIDNVYDCVYKWPKEELYGLTDQFKRAAVSVALNIAEGTGRGSKEFSHFLDFTRGSCYECVAIITIAKRRNLISEKEYLVFSEMLEKIARKTSALKKSLRLSSNDRR
jgi:four helix bundle protein